jgi:hypothetical protein
MKLTCEKTDLDYVEYLFTLAKDLEDAGYELISEDLYEAGRRIKYLAGGYNKGAAA